MIKFYFGCVDTAGHYLWKPTQWGPRRAFATSDPASEYTPWGRDGAGLDGMLAPHENRRCQYLKNGFGCQCSQTQGITAVHHKDGWTAISFWDRSVDKRGGCNSTFLAEGEFNFEEMVELAKVNFPTVMARFTFKLVKAK